MRQKEFIAYKNPDKEFELVSFEQITGKHRRLWFKSEHNLLYDDLIWAKNDLQGDKRNNILIVEHSYPVKDGIKSVRVRLADESFMKKLRKFEKGEIFLLIASFRDFKDENT